MKVNYKMRGVSKGAIPTEVTVTCRSIFVRDGALVMVGGGEDGQAVEHGIPLDRLAEWKIYRTPPAPPEPKPISGSGATAVMPDREPARVVDPYTDLRERLGDWMRTVRQNHAANEHRDEPVGGECWNYIHVKDVADLIESARLVALGAEPCSFPRCGKPTAYLQHADGGTGWGWRHVYDADQVDSHVGFPMDRKGS